MSIHREPVLAATTTLYGVGIHSLTETGAVDLVLAESAATHGGFLCTLNLDILRQCRCSPDARDLVGSASVVVADGMPLIWASRLVGEPLPERIAGSSLIWSLPERAAEQGRSIFLLGGNAGTAAGAARVLSQRYPTLRIAGTYCPPVGFEHDPVEMATIQARVADARPDIVFVGLGFPKQERLIAALRPQHPATWFVNCGVSFSFVSGEIERAPRVLQVLGLEWVHRLVHEPRRLARRYLVQGVPFFAVLMASSFVEGRRRRAMSPD